MKKSLLALTLLVLLNTSCGGTKTYLKDRALDLADMFKADIGIGLGIDARVKATELVNTGVGGSMSFRGGFKGRYAGFWFEVHSGIPVIFIHSIDGREWYCYPFITDIYYSGAAWEGIGSDVPGDYAMSSWFFNITSICNFVPKKTGKRLINFLDLVT